MVALSILQIKFPDKKNVLLEISRLIKSHGKSSFLGKEQLLRIIGSESDPEAFIDVLVDDGILADAVEKKTCCGSAFIDIDYCFACGSSTKFDQSYFYQIIDLIDYVDEWRKDITEELSGKVPENELRFIKLIVSQIKSLEKNPVIPKSERLKEQQYQVIGYRILSHVYDVEMECLTHDGRSDLKFWQPDDTSDFIGEYKIWTRRNKDDLVVDQCLNYFTPNTDAGFVFMVNDSQNNIWEKYLEKQVLPSESIVDSSGVYLVTNSEHRISIYKTLHKSEISNKTVPIFHFIYDLHAPFGGRKV